MSAPSATYTPPIEPPAQEARDAFLAHFDPLRRSGIANLFLSVIREREALVPEFVVTAVLGRLYRRLEDGWASEQALDTASATVEVIRAHRDEAIEAARYYLAYEALPEVERQRLKEQQREQGRQTYMAGVPPTGKQIAYLAALGYSGERPTSRQAASEAIDRLLAGRRRRGAQ